MSKIRTIPAQTAITSLVSLGEGDEERIAQIEVRYIELPEETRKQLDELIHAEATKALKK